MQTWHQIFMETRVKIFFVMYSALVSQVHLLKSMQTQQPYTSSSTPHYFAATKASAEKTNINLTVPHSKNKHSTFRHPNTPTLAPIINAYTKDQEKPVIIPPLNVSPENISEHLKKDARTEKALHELEDALEDLELKRKNLRELERHGYSFHKSVKTGTQTIQNYQDSSEPSMSYDDNQKTYVVLHRKNPDRLINIPRLDLSVILKDQIKAEAKRTVILAERRVYSAQEEWTSALKDEELEKQLQECLSKQPSSTKNSASLDSPCTRLVRIAIALQHKDDPSLKDLNPTNAELEKARAQLL